jgi:hypothetical protein
MCMIAVWATEVTDKLSMVQIPSQSKEALYFYHEEWGVLPQVTGEAQHLCLCSLSVQNEHKVAKRRVLHTIWSKLIKYKYLNNRQMFPSFHECEDLGGGGGGRQPPFLKISFRPFPFSSCQFYLSPVSFNNIIYMNFIITLKLPQTIYFFCTKTKMNF